MPFHIISDIVFAEPEKPITVPVGELYMGRHLFRPYESSVADAYQHALSISQS